MNPRTYKYGLGEHENVITIHSFNDDSLDLDEVLDLIRVIADELGQTSTEITESLVQARISYISDYLFGRRVHIRQSFIFGEPFHNRRKYWKAMPLITLKYYLAYAFVAAY